MEGTTMNGQGSGGGRSTLCYSVVVDPGEASSTGFQDFLETMFGARHSSYRSGDLFDLVRQGGAGGGSSMEVQPSLWLPSSPLVTLPPSEDDMAAWLYPIVSGQETAIVAGHDDHQPSDEPAGALAAVDDAPVDHKRERPPNVEEWRSGAEDLTENYYYCGSRKKATGGARRCHPSETHNLTEKRRRRKINEKLKTLQRLVPGCDDKSNQASILDQTIQHIKSLQQQIQVQRQAISLGCDGIKPPAVYPVVPSRPPYLPPGTAVTAGGDGLLPPVALAPAVLALAARGHVRPGVALAPPPSMVPFGPFLPHHHPAALMVHPPAAAAANAYKGSRFNEY